MLTGSIITTKNICDFLSSKNYAFCLEGNELCKADGYAALNECSNDKFVWVKKWNNNNRELIAKYKNLIIVCPMLSAEYLYPENGHSYIQCSDPKMIFFEVLRGFFCDGHKKKEISSTAKVYTEKIGAECVIGEYSVISNEAVIGDDVEIGNGVSVIGQVTIGNHCKIQSGAVIGGEGFGYYQTLEGHFKQVPHLGGVLIGDYVEIGANTCIDRGTMGNTVIGEHSKIDNLVHIAHNVQIGKNVLIVAGVVLGGSSQIKDGAYIAPGAIVRNQITVAENSLVGMQACVVKDTEENTTVLGVPAKIMKV